MPSVYKRCQGKKKWRKGRFTSRQTWPQLAQDLLLCDLSSLFSFIHTHTCAWTLMTWRLPEPWSQTSWGEIEGGRMDRHREMVSSWEALWDEEFVELRKKSVTVRVSAQETTYELSRDCNITGVCYIFLKLTPRKYLHITQLDNRQST